MKRLLRFLKGGECKPQRERAWMRFGVDSISFESLFSGVALVGTTGSGKSSFAELLLRKIAEHPSRPGILWACVKASEAEIAKKIARKSGRARDFVRVTADGAWTINLFDYLLNHLGQNSEGISQFLTRLAGLAVRNSNTGNDHIWAIQSTRLTGVCLDLFRVVGKVPSAMELFEVLISMPKDPIAAARDEYLTETSAGRLITRGQQHLENGDMTADDRVIFARAVEYILGYLPSLGDRFLGSVIGTAVTGLGQLLQSPFDRLFGGPSTLTPDILTEEGAIVALDLPVLTGPAAAVAQAAIIQLVQMYLLQSPRENRRPVVIVRDEAQHLVVADWDANVQTVCRSHGIISVTAVQGYSGLVAAFGGNDAARVQADMFLKHGHATHFVMNPGTDSETIKQYVELCGKRPQLMFSGSQQHNPQPSFFDQIFGIHQTPSVGWAEHMMEIVRPEHLTGLMRGGFEHDLVIQSLLFQAGKTFANGDPFTFIAVKQDITP